MYFSKKKKIIRILNSLRKDVACHHDAFCIGIFQL
jgi:hypothetical protein